jgi:hypothetical protein
VIFVNSGVCPDRWYKEERDTISLRDKTILAVAVAVFGLSLEYRAGASIWFAGCRN